MTPDDLQNLLDEVQRLRQQLNIALKQLRDLWPIKPSGSETTDTPDVIDVRIALNDETPGDAGDPDTACSYLYDLYTFDDVALAEEPFAEAVEMDGRGQRIVNAPMYPGRFGRAYQNGDNIWKLIWADEGFNQTNCVTP